jgi:glycogen(starch) synthase
VKILMFGWEFPPHISGGLGTACFGITKALVGLGHEITFVIPRILGDTGSAHVQLISASGIPVRKKAMETIKIFKGLDIRLINSTLRPYFGESHYDTIRRGRALKLPGYEKGRSEAGVSEVFEISPHYGPNLITEVIRYAKVAGSISQSSSFDVIHAHDWMTVLAGLYAKEKSGKPLILHIHSLEFDRSGEYIDQNIYYVERFGMAAADHVVTVSHYTKQVIVRRYGIPADKISVVHNAVSRTEAGALYHVEKNPDRKIILFLGRITFQKGPEYFVEAAVKVLEKIPDVTFVMAGSGDMMPQMIERVAELGIGKNFHFTGFLQGTEVEQMFTMSDLYIMPSVSEPFGISPLEAMIYDVPVIISRQSGVAEILHHALKVDFWDVNEIANKIIAILQYPNLVAEIVEKSREELHSVRWETAAEKIVEVYHRVVH